MITPNFNPRAVREGVQIRKELEENPTVDFTASGASSPEPSNAKTRMAGPGGAFAQKLMTEPDFANQVAGWRNMYNQSPQGIEFNAAMMQQQQQKLDLQQQQQNMGAA